VRVAFMGTPEFAVPSLKALTASRHEVVVVVTGADKRAGRSLKMTETAVKRLAGQLGLPLLQPTDLNDPSFISSLAGFDPDICMVVAFRILPPEVYELPPHGSINLHASLLPELRGAAPINWALMRGYTRTGLTTFQIRRKVDTGAVLLQQPVEILPDDDAGSLSARMAETGAELIIRTLDDVESGKTHPAAQRDGKATKAPRITPDTCRIDWSWSAVKIHNRVRGLSPSPGAFTMLGRKVIKLFRTLPHPEIVGSEPGVATCVDDLLRVSTGDGSLDILEIQMEGKRRLETEEFLCGRRIPNGTKLG